MWVKCFYSGRLHSAGSSGLFRAPRLGRHILAFLEHPKSEVSVVGVQLGKRLRMIESGASGVSEELWVRPTWSASSMIPDEIAATVEREDVVEDDDDLEDAHGGDWYSDAGIDGWS